jgi:DeoR family ulaG and ulaABCDEF operon transcriptional repressor
MHASQRERVILNLVAEKGFVAFRELESHIAASPATVRRDLERLAHEGKIARVHGGAQRTETDPTRGLLGTPFHENVQKNRRQKEAIGKAAASMCVAGEAIMMDGGSTTLQMCPHLAGLGLQVLTNSLHIVSALLDQPSTRVSVPGGAVFREQNIVLSADGEDLMPSFVAPKLFMGAAGVGLQGVFQADVILVAAQRRLIERAEQTVLLVDSSKFLRTSGHVVCGLTDIDVIITDCEISQIHRAMLQGLCRRLIIAD